MLNSVNNHVDIIEAVIIIELIFDGENEARIWRRELIPRPLRHTLNEPYQTLDVRKPHVPYHWYIHTGNQEV